jgi:predicted ATPase
MAGNRSRIAIIGAGGVGKTTLLDNLFKYNNVIQSYSKIEEVVRILCTERGYHSPYDIPELELHQFRMEVLDRQISLENEAHNFIIDRSTLDAWAYFMRWSWNTCSVELAETFYEKAYAQASKYDLLIYIPIMFPAVDDGFRWTNPIYHKQIDRLLRSIIRDWGLEDRVYEIEAVDLSKRVEELKQQLL